MLTEQDVYSVEGLLEITYNVMNYYAIVILRTNSKNKAQNKVTIYIFTFKST